MAETGTDDETVIRDQIQRRWQVQADEEERRTEREIAQRLHELGRRGLIYGSASQAAVARVVRDEGLRLMACRLEITKEVLQKAGKHLTLERMALIEADVQDLLRKWTGRRTPYLSDRLAGLGADSATQTAERVADEVRLKASRDLELTRGEILLAAIQNGSRRLPTDSPPAVSGSPHALRVAEDSRILTSLESIDMGLAASFRQVCVDLSAPDRHSYLGPVAELREVVTGVIHALAPVEAVTEWLTAAGEAPEVEGKKPSRAQRVRYVLSQQGRPSKSTEALRRADAHLEELLATAIAGWYNRASQGTHAGATHEEAIRIFRHATAFLQDLLPAAGP